MDFHASLAKLTRSPVFKEWHGKNKDAFLAHGFLMLDEANKDMWQFGFYEEKKERMVTFLVGETIKHTEEQEVLKSEGTIDKLPVNDVKITPEEALVTFKKIISENYKSEIPLKQFFIVQHAEGHTMYNMTVFTQSFKTVNVKIDAKTGNVIKHDMQVLADFG